MPGASKESLFSRPSQPDATKIWRGYLMPLGVEIAFQARKAESVKDFLRMPWTSL